MKKLLFALTAIISLHLYAQEDPASWTTEVNKISDTEYATFIDQTKHYIY